MSIKEQALQTIGGLPETADWEEIKERINFVSAIKKGLDELNAGSGVPVEQIEKELEEWISK
jgi:predicted transcriptional regulator